MNTKNILKRIAGKKILEHKIAIIANVRYFKKYYGIHKVFLFLFYYFYKNIFDTIYSQRFEVKIHGFNMKLIPDDEGISKELKVFKNHEPLVTNLLNNILKPNMTCIDIGGNIGYYVLQERNIIGKNGKIITFEPSPRNFDFLNENLKRNNISNVEAFNFAIGGMTGQKKFLLTQASNSSRIVNDLYNDDSKTILVKMMTLDEFFSHHDVEKIDFLRMDIEGSEFDAYNGMRRTIEEFRPLLLIEIHNSYLGTEKTINFLTKLKQDGYDIEYYISRNVDVPFIGNTEDVKNYSLENLIDGLRSNDIPDTFHLFLKNMSN